MEEKLKYFGFANFSLDQNKLYWIIIEEYNNGNKKCYYLDGTKHGRLNENNIKKIIEKY